MGAVWYPSPTVWCPSPTGVDGLGRGVYEAWARLVSGVIACRGVIPSRNS